jgi:hypothetical protein
MPLRKNTDMRDAQVEFTGALFDAGTLEIYSGMQPADPNSGPSGVLLATINIPNPAFGAASSGVIAKSGIWSAVAVATGTAGWARFISASTSETFDAVVTDIPGGNDLLLNSLDITIGDTVTVISLTLTTPES